MQYVTTLEFVFWILVLGLSTVAFGWWACTRSLGREVNKTTAFIWGLCVMFLMVYLDFLQTAVPY